MNFEKIKNFINENIVSIVLNISCSLVVLILLWIYRKVIFSIFRSIYNYTQKHGIYFLRKEEVSSLKNQDYQRTEVVETERFLQEITYYPYRSNYMSCLRMSLLKCKKHKIAIKEEMFKKSYGYEKVFICRLCMEEEKNYSGLTENGLKLEKSKIESIFANSHYLKNN